MDRSVWREYGEPLAGPTGSGPLAGVRVAVKDLYAVAGHRTGAGNPTWLAGAATEPVDASAVARLRAAGASVVGIARTDELAFALSGQNVHYGTPPNPAAPSLITGGSSNGPAAAVALGQADVGLGTDTAGSVRVPASCCGLFALRPTHDAVPTDGIIALAPSFDTVGWITRDAATLRAVGEVMLPPDRPDVGAGVTVEGHPAPRRLVLLSSMMDGLAPAVVRTIGRAAGALAAAWGARLSTDEDVVAGWPADPPALQEAFRVAQAAQAWQFRGAWIDAHPGALAPDVEARFRFGGTLLAAGGDGAGRVAAAWSVLAGWRAVLRSQLAGGVWFALPAAAGPGHPRTDTGARRDAWRGATLRLTVVSSAGGLPSVVVPARRHGEPVGLAVVAAPGQDRALLTAVDHAAGQYCADDDA